MCRAWKAWRCPNGIWGWSPPASRWSISRHGGILPACWRTLDIDRLLALSELAAMPIGEWGEQLAADAGEGLTLALADDEAFNFITPITWRCWRAAA
jgi:cobyrinic acid a,c-diamide synthase